MALTIAPLPSAWPSVSQLSQQIAVVSQSSFQYLENIHRPADSALNRYATLFTDRTIVTTTVKCTVTVIL